MAGRPVRGHRHFVGRDHELAVIGEACAAARRGAGGLLVVRGDVGIGKTALCEQAAERAEQAGFAVGWGRCWSEGGAPPLWPWPEVLADLGGPDAVSLLAEDAGRPGLDPDRFARFMAVADVLAERASETPLMIVIDDAHVADTAALLLARYLTRSVGRRPVVMVLTRRPSEAIPRASAESLLDELERDATVVQLASFDRHETAAFLSAHELAVEEHCLVAALTRMTNGNPLLLARAVVRTSAADALGAVEGVIGDALGVLSPEHRRVVAMAAVLGMVTTATDVAALAGADPEDVHLALSAASCSGLMDRGQDGWTFTHDLVRRAALEALTPLEAMAAHARAVAVVPADNRPSSVARRAHHALLAAPRSEADAWRAVSKCRHAARVLATGFDYERAAGLLDSAVALVERLSPPAEHVELLLEWADARQVCGLLADARVAYERAAAAAQAAVDPSAQARAALGLGGVWVNEHRGQVDRARVLELQRSALDGLPPANAELRTRLEVRLAAEAVYDGAPVGPVFETLAEARQLDDPRALAEALSLSHHALLAPEYLTDRLAIADDLIRVATSDGDSLRVLFGLLWKAVDQFHGGDAAAVRTLNELRHRADAVGCRTVSYMVSAIDVMRSIREGRLDEAEAAAHDTFTFGIDLGDGDATGYYGVHLLTIRWLQDRDAELLDLARDIASSDTLVAPDFAFRAGVAAVAARAGLVEEAIAGVRSLGPLDALPRSSTWLAGMVILMEAAWALGDGELASELSPLLEPFADRPAMPSLAVSCFGSVERALGLGALLTGHADEAVDHLERAVQANAALGHWPLVALSRADLAEALERRRRAGDRAASRAAWERAASEATSMGMDRRAATWLARAGELAAPDTDAAVLRRDGDQWVVDVDDRQVVVPDLVGFRYLGWLLAHPGDEISAVELCGGASIHEAGYELLDRDALDAYRRRVQEIDRLLESAGRRDDAARIATLQREREELRDALSADLARSGNSRRFVDSGERARTAVRKALTRAIDVIAASHDELGAELRDTITTGRRCAYLPDPTRSRRWSVVVAA